MSKKKSKEKLESILNGVKPQHSKTCGMQPEQDLEGNTYIRKERYQINDLSFHHKKPEKNKLNPKSAEEKK